MEGAPPPRPVRRRRALLFSGGLASPASATVASREPGALPYPATSSPIPGQLALPGNGRRPPRPAGGTGGQPTLARAWRSPAPRRPWAAGGRRRRRARRGGPAALARGSTRTARLTAAAIRGALDMLLDGPAHRPVPLGPAAQDREEDAPPGRWWRSRWPRSLRLADGLGAGLHDRGRGRGLQVSRTASAGWMIPARGRQPADAAGPGEATKTAAGRPGWSGAAAGEPQPGRATGTAKRAR